MRNVPLVLVTVGTDHHPFGRLMGWVEKWAATGRPVRWRVQHGFTPAPQGDAVEATEMMPHDGLQQALGEASVIVCQGGPGSIMDARGVGKVPIVVPRQSGLGEHVDDHQVRFARRLDEAGLIRMATTEDDFRSLVAAALDSPAQFSASPDQSDIAETVKRFGVLIDELMAKPARRPLLPMPRR